MCETHCSALARNQEKMAAPKILVKQTRFQTQKLDLQHIIPNFSLTIFGRARLLKNVLRRGRSAFEVVFTGWDRTDRRQTPTELFYPDSEVETCMNQIFPTVGQSGQGGTSYNLKYIHRSASYCRRRLRSHLVAVCGNRQN